MVLRGKWLYTQVAVKKLNNLPEFLNPSDIKSFRQEIATLTRLCHQRIVKLFEYCKKDDVHYLVTEYIKGGNLWDYIHSKHPITKAHIANIALSISQAMNFLYSKEIMH